MRTKTCLILAALIGAEQAGAEPGFDERYERDYNIFTPANQYAPDNPLNPANKYNPGVPFTSLDGKARPEITGSRSRNSR